MLSLLPVPALLVRSLEVAPRPGEGSHEVLLSDGIGPFAAGLVGGEEVLVELALGAAEQGAELTRELSGLRTDRCFVRAVPRPMGSGVLVEFIDDTELAVGRRRDDRGRSVLERLVEALPVAAAAKDPGDGLRFTVVNRRFAAALGIRAEEVLGRCDHDLFPPEVADQLRGDDLAALGGSDARVAEAPLETALGRRRARTIRVPVRGGGGRPELLLVMIEDLAGAAPRAGWALGARLPARVQEGGRSAGARMGTLAAAGGRGPGRVLLGEDDAVSRRIAARHLESLGHEVVLAGTGARALELLAEQRARFDFLVVDLWLADLDGFALIRALRALEAQERAPAGEGLPVVAVTPGEGDMGAAERDRLHAACLEVGADGWLEKPLRAGGLDRELRRIDRRP